MGDSVVVDQPGSTGVIGSFVKSTTESLTTVFGNRNLRRLQLAFGGSLIGNWAFGTATAVWAYDVAGPKAVGIYAALKLFVAAFVSPFAAPLADRYPRRLVMMFSDLFSCLMVTAAAVCLYLGTPALPVFVFAILSWFGLSPFRAASGAILPSIARSPEELTASNGASATLESLAFGVGPAVASILLLAFSIPVAFLFNAATFLWSILMVAGIRVPGKDVDTARIPAADPPVDPPAEAEQVQGKHKSEVTEERETAEEGYWTEMAAGFRAIWRDKDLLLAVSEGTAQTLVAGAENVLPVVFAVQILGSGPKGVGWLGSALGVGAVLGGVYALSRASKHKLGQDLIVGVMLWSLPLLLVTVWPTPIAAFTALALLGFGNPMVDVNMDTLIQRLTPDAVLGRVFGAQWTVVIGGMAVGAAITPLLLHLTGMRATCAIFGLFVGGVALLGLPRMRRLDKRLEPPQGLALLRAIPMFAPLNPVVQDALARALVPVEHRAGDVIMRVGDQADRFFIIESGLVEVTAPDGHFLRHEGAGDHFGEIGLLHDVPRTATITALEDTRLLALERQEFLDAVTGQGEARRLAEDVASRRLMA